jgi:hypothetical protein
MDTNMQGAPASEQATGTSALALGSQPTVRHLVILLNSDLQILKDNVARKLRAEGLSGEYLRQDFPNTETHRENNRRVKVVLTDALKFLPGVEKYFPSPNSSPKQVYDLIDKAHSRPATTLHQTLLEFAAVDRSQFGSFEEMILQVLCLRSKLEKTGITFTERAAAHVILHNLSRDTKHVDWIKDMLRKDIRNHAGWRGTSFLWGDLMTKLSSLSASEQPKAATTGTT